MQADSLDKQPLPAVRLKRHTAQDLDSRWDAFEEYRSAASGNALMFLDTLIEWITLAKKS